MANAEKTAVIEDLAASSGIRAAPGAHRVPRS